MQDKLEILTYYKLNINYLIIHLQYNNFTRFFKDVIKYQKTKKLFTNENSPDNLSLDKTHKVSTFVQLLIRGQKKHSSLIDCDN